MLGGVVFAGGEAAWNKGGVEKDGIQICEMLRPEAERRRDYITLVGALVLSRLHF